MDDVTVSGTSAAATATLFGITLVSAILHLISKDHGGSRPTAAAATLIVLSISIPAVGAARVMREESNDWFGVMRFHDVELIT